MSSTELRAVQPANNASATSWRRVAVVGIAALLCAILAGAFFVQRGTAEAQNTADAAAVDLAFAPASETEVVTARARDILTTIYSYGYDTIDGHADAIKPLMTQRMFDEYMSTSPPNAEIVKQAQTQVSAQIGESGLGIATLTEDRAVVEVVLAVSGDNGGVELSDAMFSIRMVMDKVDGTWLASDIQLI